MSGKGQCLIVCKYCGKLFTSTYYKQLSCPDCAAKNKRKTLLPRVCRSCGITFDGGPRAWYCPSCRADRHRAADLASKKRAARGQTRKIGSVDSCVVCGAEYTVNNARQKYCKTCAPVQVKLLDAQASRQYIRDHDKSRKAQSDWRAQRIAIPCIDCGKSFVPTDSSKRCADCRAAKQKNPRKA